MSIYIDFAKGKKCWNIYETVYTCIRCGCCSKDKNERYKNRVRVLKRLLQEEYNFNDWDDDPELKAIQERNIKSNIRYFKKKLRYYEKIQSRKETGGTKNETNL